MKLNGRRFLVLGFILVLILQSTVYLAIQSLINTLASHLSEQAEEALRRVRQELVHRPASGLEEGPGLTLEDPQLKLNMEQGLEIFRDEGFMTKLWVIDKNGLIRGRRDSSRADFLLKDGLLSSLIEKGEAFHQIGPVEAYAPRRFIMALPVESGNQVTGLLWGEFRLGEAIEHLIQVQGIVLRSMIVNSALIVGAGLIMIAVQIRRRFRIIHRRLEEYILALEKANESIRVVGSELLASEKLADIGRLVTGTAHEVGNPLSSILGYMEILKKDRLDKSTTQDLLNRVESEIQRIHKITSELLDFARPHTSHLEVLDVLTVLDKALSLVAPQIKKQGIKVVKDLARYPLYARVDEHKLQQVFINLFLNALQAMPEKGTLTISAFEGARPMDRKWRDAEMLAVQIADTGCGIPEKNLAKIFDPFFTTKEPGKGAGLGLTISRKIISSLGGAIEVQSEEGKGTTFTVLLPSVRKKGG